MREVKRNAERIDADALRVVFEQYLPSMFAAEGAENEIARLCVGRFENGEGCGEARILALEIMAPNAAVEL